MADVKRVRRNLRLGEDGRWRRHWDPAFMAPQAVAEKEASRQERMRLLEQAAKDLRVPLVVLRGALSDVVGPADVERFLRAVPHAEVIDLPGTGHTAAGADNDAFSTAVGSSVAWEVDRTSGRRAKTDLYLAY
ncbi:alpha/beta fold hydrolase [Actinomadura sp. SCN-SB]|uniref:alpha/beta fold hydrolase n=1 Tax=Actinomadura sp. SCN-SB TaxID=3373092 RepID=UPI0037504B19